MIHASWTNTKELDKIKKQLNRDFEKVGDWLVDNKLSTKY